MKNSLYIVAVLFFSQITAICQDVGVFYMPYWHKNSPPIPEDQNCITTTLNVSGETVEKYFPCDNPPGNWNTMQQYNLFLAQQSGGANDIRVPMNLYYPSPVWYNESWKHVGEIQHSLMKEGNIDFVIYDSYFSFNSVSNTFNPYWQHAMANELKSGFNNHGVKFGIMWADRFLDLVNGGMTSCTNLLDNRVYKDLISGKVIILKSGLDAMADFWSQFMKHPNYKKIDGKPVFYVYYGSTSKSHEINGGNYANNVEGICDLCQNHNFFPTSLQGAEPNNIHSKKTKFLLEKLEAKLAERGVQTPLYKVAVITPSHVESERLQWLINHPRDAGYQAITTYGYKYYDEDDHKMKWKWSANNWPNKSKDSDCDDKWDYTFSDMRRIYKDYHSYISTRTSVDYQVPVSAGWNRSSLNMKEGQGTEDTWYKNSTMDCAISNASSFKAALQDAKNVVEAHPDITRNRVMLCCWNEYAEGAVIEPTSTFGKQYIEQVASVFPNNAGSKLIEAEENSPQEISHTRPHLSLDIYPNPTDVNLSIDITLAVPSKLKIILLSMSGQIIEEIYNNNLAEGPSVIHWNPGNIGSGLYFIRVEAGEYYQMKRIIIE